MRQSKYTAQLQNLLQRPGFTIGDADQLGIPRHALAYFVKTGVLERVYNGVYRYADDFVILCKTEPEAERALA
jgi:hypothetical protein